MKWALSVDGQSGLHIWKRQIGDVQLSVYQNGDMQNPWAWTLRYGIVTVTGYARTIRAAKMRASRTARQYALQGELWAL